VWSPGLRFAHVVLKLAVAAHRCDNMRGILLQSISDGETVCGRRGVLVKLADILPVKTRTFGGSRDGADDILPHLTDSSQGCVNL
jgi:hypothetical protein